MIKTAKYYLGFWLIVILFYVSIINLFVLRTTPEVLFVQFAFIILIFRLTRVKEFGRDWIPFIGFFLLYEFLRGFSDNVSPFREYSLQIIFQLENSIFATLPTVTLQRIFSSNSFATDFSVFFYISFFYYSFFVAFLLWLYKRNLFVIYYKQFLILTLIGLTLFFLLPTAPPWLIQRSIDLGIQRFLYDNSLINSYSGLSLYGYFIRGNEVAAFPSLHSAWPMFTSLFLVKYLENKLKYFSLIVPIMIGFSVVLTGEHFVVDVLAGYLLSYLVIHFGSSKINTKVIPPHTSQ